MTSESDELWFENPPMGQRTRILTYPGETGGTKFVLDIITKPHCGKFAVPAHFHPTMTETFEVVSGRARYRLGGVEGTAGPGDRIVMGAGIPHIHPWSDSDEELHTRQIAESSPPDTRGMNASLQALVTIAGFASAGKVNKKGLPPLLQVAVLVEETIPTTFVAGPPALVQRVLSSGLAGIARAAGYKAGYPRYGVITDRGLERTL